MYIIKCDNYILNDYRYEELVVKNPKLDLEVNKCGLASFKIYPSHPYYNKIKMLKSLITIYQDNKIIFKGRPTDDELGFYNEKSVTVEGILAYLLDSIQEPFEYQGNIEDFFVKLINNHNSQVEPFQRFKIGRITVMDPNDYINRSSSEYLTTSKVIETKLLQLNGGYLNIRYEDDGNYIDYLADFEDTSVQVIEYGENLINLTQKIDAINIKTGIIPLGAKLKDEEGNETNARLTIESVNNGIKYLVDENMVQQYGKIFQVIIYEDVTVASNLLMKAQQDLVESVKLSNTIELTAVDLNNVDKNIESFYFCDYIKIVSKPHNISKTFLLRKMSIDLQNVQNTKITLGETIKTLTDTTNNFNKNNNDIINKIYKIESDYTQLSQSNNNWVFKLTEIIKEIKKINTTINNNGIAFYENDGEIDPNTTLEELILTNHENKPKGDIKSFFFIRTMFFLEKSETSARRQIAYQHTGDIGVYTRNFTNEEGWSNWVNLSNNLSISTDGEAVPTGKIIDGKLEYIKRLNFGNLPNATIKRMATGLTLANVTITDVKAIPRKTNGDVNVITFADPSILTRNISIYLSANDNSLVVDCGEYDRSDFTMNVDIYYINN